MCTTRSWIQILSSHNVSVTILSMHDVSVIMAVGSIFSPSLPIRNPRTLALLLQIRISRVWRTIDAHVISVELG